MKAFPTREKFAFVVCDDIRAEANDKVSLMGWFPDGVVVVDSKNEGPVPAVVDALAFGIAILDGEGEFSATVQIIGPDGPIAPKNPQTHTIVKLRGRALSITLKAVPFEFRSFGAFTLRLTMDDRAYDFPFEMRDARLGKSS